MKKFMLLHYGFEKPTEAIMKAWDEWFASIAERTVEHGGFHAGGREVSAVGVSELPFGPGSITGYSIIHAEDAEQAVEIAKKNPFIDSIRVYEITG